MKALRVLAGFALIVLALFVCAGRVQATDLSGSYSTTQYINDDSRLVGDVTCEPTLAKEPCIVFGAPHIKLRLNGFTITGPVDPITNLAACGTIPDFQSGAIGIGVEAVGQNDIEIEGPGQIRHFVNWGIFLGNKTFATPGMPPEVTGLIVRRVTAAFNCWSGVQILGVADSTFEDNVLANNAVGSNGAGCGGICLSDSSKNRFHKNAFNGNGAATPGSSSGANNFGIGLEGMSNENQIEGAPAKPARSRGCKSTALKE
jgi:hypothetical protein